MRKGGSVGIVEIGLTFLGVFMLLLSIVLELVSVPGFKNQLHYYGDEEALLTRMVLNQPLMIALIIFVGGILGFGINRIQAEEPDTGKKLVGLGVALAVVLAATIAYVVYSPAGLGL